MRDEKLILMNLRQHTYNVFGESYWPIGLVDDPDTGCRSTDDFDNHVNGAVLLTGGKMPPTFVVGSTDDTLKLWNANGRLIKTFEGHVDWINSIARMTRSGNMFISGSEDKTLKFWHVDGGCFKTFDCGASVSWIIKMDHNNIVFGTSDSKIRTLSY